jgi:hypothetical protein
MWFVYFYFSLKIRIIKCNLIAIKSEIKDWFSSFRTLTDCKSHISCSQSQPWCKFSNNGRVSRGGLNSFVAFSGKSNSSANFCLSNCKCFSCIFSSQIHKDSSSRRLFDPGSSWVNFCFQQLMGENLLLTRKNLHILRIRWLWCYSRLFLYILEVQASWFYKIFLAGSPYVELP